MKKVKNVRHTARKVVNAPVHFKLFGAGILLLLAGWILQFVALQYIYGIVNDCVAPCNSTDTESAFTKAHTSMVVGSVMTYFGFTLLVLALVVLILFVRKTAAQSVKK